MKYALYVVGTVFIVGLLLLAVLPKPTSTPTQYTDTLKKFGSYDELKTFLAASSEVSSFGLGSGAVSTDMMMKGAAPMAAGMETSAASQNSMTRDTSASYSTTNNQVAGVDEADIVKNDGKYIYSVSGSSVVITDAYPPEAAKIVSQIDLNNTSVSGIFINGDKLVVFGNEYTTYPESMKTVSGGVGIASDIMMPPRPYYNSGASFIRIYDVSDRSNPTLTTNLTVSGYYSDSRMIGDYVYAIVNQPVYSGDVIPTPIVMTNGVAVKSFPDIYYFDTPFSSYNYVNIVALNTNTGETTTKTFMMPSSQTTFVSQDNIYLTYQKWLSYADFYDRIVDEVIIPSVPSLQSRISEIRNYNISATSKLTEIETLLQNYLATLSPQERSGIETSMQEKMVVIQQDIEKERQKTYISKISVSGLQITYSGQGSVSGSLLNQFSMDEYNGYFRIATTVSSYANNEYTTMNNLYVLDSNMKTVGTLDNVAPGESIYSVRFMGDRAYMVTFKQVDPLFVIDLTDPTAPTILGRLTIPGYSDYLQPYDATHLIGIGKEVDPSIDADKVHTTDAIYYTAIQGVKISIFDVSDVSNPVEMFKTVIGDRGTSSLAATDHKALLFDKEKQLLVVPMTVVERKATDPVSAYGENTFDGAYVYNINLQDGLTLLGRVTHMNSTEVSDMTMKGYWYGYGTGIKRSLYIDNTLYTLSDKMIKANDLTTLSEINTVALPFQNYYGGPIMYATAGVATPAMI